MSERPEIITAAIAAFDNTGRLNESANISYLQRLKPFSDGVLAAGTTAEFPSLSPAERTQLIGWSIEIFGPERTIAQIGAPSVSQALALMDMAADSGATRFAAITPYYLTASQHGVIDYYRSLREHTEGKLYAYVFPDVANTDVTAHTITLLQSLGLNGVKLSGTAAARVREYRRAAPRMDIWSGSDGELPQTMKEGGAGTVSGVSGVTPQVWATLRDALAAEQPDQIDAAQSNAERMVRVLGPSISRLKYALTQLGIPAGHCRMPIDEPDGPTRSAIRGVLAEYARSIDASVSTDLPIQRR